jgi:zinc protease
MAAIWVRRARVVWILMGYMMLLGASHALIAQAGNPAPSGSDITPDPAVLFGSLSNGMQYEIRRNTGLTGQTALRLRVAVGSANEGDDERGIAHFLEHMAFRGSTHYADGEAWKTLERLGLQMGADANANTYLSQTVYKFDFPASDAASVNTGLTLLREIAGELKLDASSVQAERKVVLSEARLRDVPATQAGDAAVALLLQGQVASRRSPIGTTDVIEHMTAAALRRFYQRYYRPERTVLVAVGDFDPHQMEAQIRTAFADWHGVGTAGPQADFGVPVDGGAMTRVISGSGLDPDVSLNWITPLPPGPETRHRDVEENTELIAAVALNSILVNLTTAPGTTVRQVAVGPVKMLHSAHIFGLDVHYSGPSWLTPLSLADAIRRKAVAKGLSQTVVDDAVTRVLTIYQQRADGAATQRAAQTADEMVRALDDGEIYTSPAQDLTFAQEMLKGLTAEAANTALRAAFKGIGPRVVLMSPEPVPGGEAAVASSVANLEATDLNSLGPQAVEVPKANWPYAQFGVPSDIVERRHVDDLDTTLVRFGNGVRLNVKRTTFSAGEISVLVSVGDGRLELPKDRRTSIWAAQGGAFVVGGLRDLDIQAINRAMLGKVASVRFSLGDLGFELGGLTRPADLDAQLQLLAAYLKAPGFRPQPFAAVRTGTLAQINQLQSTPMGLFGASFLGLLHANDPRWMLPTDDQIQTAQPDEVRALLANSMMYGPVEITVVGDVEVERAIEAVGKTFGALAPRTSRTIAVSAADVKFPAPTPKPVILPHQGRTDQGVAAIAWPTTDLLADVKQAQALQLLCDVVQLRLTEQLRMAAGDSYTTQCVSNSSITLPGFGFLAASADIQPEKSAVFFSTVLNIVRDLRTQTVGQDEWDRVAQSATSKLKTEMQGNGFWIGVLSRPQLQPRRLDYARTALATLQSLTAADVQKAARRFLNDNTAFRLVVSKEGGP